jgi:glycerophosphoryl diester phosphodiesterase
MRRTLQALTIDPLFAAAWHQLRRCWQPMAGWTLLAWAAVAAVVVPLSSAVTAWRFRSPERWVLGNEELLTWVLSVEGLAYLLLAGSAAATSWMLRYAALFQIAVDDLEGRSTEFGDEALRLARRAPTLLRFALKSTALALAAAAALGGGLWLVHAGFLREHDINYYLARKPPEWTHALIAAGLWLLVAGSTCVWLASRIALALPAWLDGHRGFLSALRTSWRLTRSRAHRVLRAAAVIAGGWLLLRFAANAVFLFVAAQVAEAIAAWTTQLWPLLACIGAYLLGSLLLDLAIDFLGFSFLATLLTRFYLEDTPLHQATRARGEEATLPRTFARWLQPHYAVLLVLIAAGASAGLGWHLLRQLPPPRPVIVTAHRAGPPPAPENTLAALERAIAAGADFAEIDVQRTRDGVVVVAHDADLMRMAGDARRLSQHRYAELARVVQQPDDGSPPEDRRLATLGDFLHRARGRIRLNIELKYYGRDPLLAESVVREVQAQAMDQDVVITSLSLDAIRQVRALAPGIAVGYISSFTIGPIDRVPVTAHVVHQRRLTPQLVRHAHANGREVHAWTVNSVARMADLIEMGVDGIVTDDPLQAVRVRRELRDLGPAQRLLLRFRALLLRDATAARETPARPVTPP